MDFGAIAAVVGMTAWISFLAGLWRGRSKGDEEATARWKQIVEQEKNSGQAALQEAVRTVASRSVEAANQILLNYSALTGYPVPQIGVEFPSQGGRIFGFEGDPEVTEDGGVVMSRQDLETLKKWKITG